MSHYFREREREREREKNKYTFSFKLNDEIIENAVHIV